MNKPLPTIASSQPAKLTTFFNSSALASQTQCKEARQDPMKFLVDNYELTEGTPIWDFLNTYVNNAEHIPLHTLGLMSASFCFVYHMLANQSTTRISPFAVSKTRSAHKESSLSSDDDDHENNSDADDNAGDDEEEDEQILLLNKDEPKEDIMKNTFPDGSNGENDYDDAAEDRDYHTNNSSDNNGEEDEKKKNFVTPIKKRHREEKKPLTTTTTMTKTTVVTTSKSLIEGDSGKQSKSANTKPEKKERKEKNSAESYRLKKPKPLKKTTAASTTSTTTSIPTTTSDKASTFSSMVDNSSSPPGDYAQIEQEGGEQLFGAITPEEEHKHREAKSRTKTVRNESTKQKNPSKKRQKEKEGKKEAEKEDEKKEGEVEEDVEEKTAVVTSKRTSRKTKKVPPSKTSKKKKTSDDKSSKEVRMFCGVIFSSPNNNIWSHVSDCPTCSHFHVCGNIFTFGKSILPYYDSYYDKKDKKNNNNNDDEEDEKRKSNQKIDLRCLICEEGDCKRKTLKFSSCVQRCENSKKIVNSHVLNVYESVQKIGLAKTYKKYYDKLTKREKSKFPNLTSFGFSKEHEEIFDNKKNNILYKPYTNDGDDDTGDKNKKKKNTKIPKEVMNLNDKPLKILAKTKSSSKQHIFDYHIMSARYNNTITEQEAKCLFATTVMLALHVEMTRNLESRRGKQKVEEQGVRGKKGAAKAPEPDDPNEIAVLRLERLTVAIKGALTHRIRLKRGQNIQTEKPKDSKSENTQKNKKRSEKRKEEDDDEDQDNNEKVEEEEEEEKEEEEAVENNEGVEEEEEDTEKKKSEDNESMVESDCSSNSKAKKRNKEKKKSRSETEDRVDEDDDDGGDDDDDDEDNHRDHKVKKSSQKKRKRNEIEKKEEDEEDIRPPEKKRSKRSNTKNTAPRRGLKKMDLSEEKEETTENPAKPSKKRKTEEITGEDERKRKKSKSFQETIEQNDDNDDVEVVKGVEEEPEKAQKEKSRFFWSASPIEEEKEKEEEEKEEKEENEEEKEEERKEGKKVEEEEEEDKRKQKKFQWKVPAPIDSIINNKEEPFEGETEDGKNLDGNGDEVGMEEVQEQFDKGDYSQNDQTIFSSQMDAPFTQPLTLVEVGNLQSTSTCDQDIEESTSILSQQQQQQQQQQQPLNELSDTERKKLELQQIQIYQTRFPDEHVTDQNLHQKDFTKELNNLLKNKVDSRYSLLYLLYNRQDEKHKMEYRRETKLLFNNAMVVGGEKFQKIIGEIATNMGVHVATFPDLNEKMKKFYEHLPMTADPDIHPSLVKNCSFEIHSAPQLLTFILFECFPIMMGKPEAASLIT